nr:RES family NAD+ phosphorylase [Microvirga arsenatis]
MFRVHRHTFDPVFFGPGAGKPAAYRFDAPNGEYGVLYIGFELESAFVETLLRNPAVRLVSQSEIDERHWTEFQTTRELRLAMMHGNGLSTMGATAIVTSGGYPRSRAWSHAIWSHPDSVDGIAYQSKHDPERKCIALFDRAADAINLHNGPQPFNTSWIAETLKHYGKGLDVS